MADVNQILRVYGKHLQKNVRLKAIAERAWNYDDAHKFADEAAGVLCDVLKMYIDPATVTYDDAVQIFEAVMQKNYSEVTRVCAKVQQGMYRKAGVGLNALTPEFNAEKARGLATAITEQSNYEKLIQKTAQNWESERIACMDMVILQAALAEIYSFPTIPINVTLNEFIEISKYYSTEKSSLFINGILDKIVTDLRNEGTLIKVGIYTANN